MEYLEQRRAFVKLHEANDLEGIRNLLRDNPDYLRDRNSSADMLDAAAGYHSDNIPLLSLLHEFGISLDITRTDDPIGRALYSAACLSRWENVRWLIEHGAKVNWEGSDWAVRCVPLSTVIRSGRLDIVQLLVEAGAKLDVCDRTMRTPLTWAIDYKQHEIAEYLRTKGAVESHLGVNYVAPRPSDKVLDVLRERFLKVPQNGWRRIITDTPITVHRIHDNEFVGIATVGLSDVPMVRADGSTQRIELVVPLPMDWPEDESTWNTERYVWVVNWVLNLSEQFAGNRVALPEPHVIISNGDGPAPLSQFTSMTCWLGLVDKPPLESFERDDGELVQFYTLLPIHTAERDFELKHGLRALLEKFATSNTPNELAADRPSVV
jgi:Suppressor of fused protein (SUFU)